MASAVDMMNVDIASAAQRRRERRLRQFLRHERLSVAMALPEKKHHTSRGQRKDRAGRWVRDVLHGQVPGAPTRSRRRSPAVPGHPVCVSRGATGEGPAVHRRAARRRRTHGADSGHSWVVGGRSGGGGAAEARRAGCRAGHRSALDLFGPGLPAFCQSSSAEGRVLGGSADGAWIITGGHCHAGPGAEGSSGTGGADRWVGGRVVEVFKVLSQFRVQQRLWSRSLTFQPAVGAFKVFTQARVPLLPHRVVCMTRVQGCFSHFSPAQKSAKVTRQSSPRVPASVSSSELSAHQMARAGESDGPADEPGGALDAALADLQRWRRG